MEAHAPSEASTTSAAAANATAYAVAATKMCTIGDTSAKHVYLSSPHKGMV